MTADEPQDLSNNEPSKKVRLWCFGCNHWTEVGRDGPKHIFVGHLLPEDPEAEGAAELSASFMRRHLTQCKRAVMAVSEDMPGWAELGEANRE